MSSSVARRTSSAFQLDAVRERLRGQLVQRARRLVRLDDDLLAAGAVADLGARAGDQLGGLPEPDDLARDDHGDAVGELLRLVEVVRRQQHRLPEPAQRAHELPGVAARGGVEAGRRLVEEDELRVADERDPEVEPPLLPARERLHLRVALLVEADEVDHLVDVARVLVVAGEHPVDLAHRQHRPELRFLQHDADPLAEGALGLAGIEAEHADLARVPLAGSPRGSRPSSSCRRRSGRAARTPRPPPPRSRSPGPPRRRRRTCAGR